MDSHIDLFAIGSLLFLPASNPRAIGHARESGADLVILDKDFFTVPDEEIKTIVAKLTIVNGKIVYRDSDYTGVAPAQPVVIPAWSPVKYYGGYQQ